MPEWLIRCPETGQLVPTGQKLARSKSKARKGLLQKLFSRRRGQRNFKQPGYMQDTDKYVLQCPLCGQEHEWRLAEAYLSV